MRALLIQLAMPDPHEHGMLRSPDHGGRSDARICSVLHALSIEEGSAMELKFMWKDVDSGGTGCPGLYETDGGYVVQGVKLDDATRAQLRQLNDGEDAVFVPANVLDRLRELA